MGKEETLGKIKAAQGGSKMDDKYSRYQGELQKIAKKGRVDTNTIKVQEITDHKNISLWTREGKRIGPLHPHNAERTFKLFWEMGVELTADQPTADEIAVYKETDEYKEKMEAHNKRRAIKEKSRKKGQMEKILKEMSAMTGMTVEALTRIAGPADRLTPPDNIARAPQHVDPDMRK